MESAKAAEAAAAAAAVVAEAAEAAEIVVTEADCHHCRRPLGPHMLA